MFLRDDQIPANSRNSDAKPDGCLNLGYRARRNAEKPRSGVTSSTGWPNSVGHRRTLLVGDGPVSRVRCGRVPIHAPTPISSPVRRMMDSSVHPFPENPSRSRFSSNRSCFRSSDRFPFFPVPWTVRHRFVELRRQQCEVSQRVDTPGAVLKRSHRGWRPRSARTVGGHTKPVGQDCSKAGFRRLVDSR